MDKDRIIRNIRNNYAVLGLYMWSNSFPLTGGDDKKRLFLNKNVQVIGYQEHEQFRVYTIVTSWVCDPVIEFLIPLTNDQELRLKDDGWYKHDGGINDEISRWNIWGTSIVCLDKIDIAETWAKDAFDKALKTINKEQLKAVDNVQ